MNPVASISTCPLLWILVILPIVVIVGLVAGPAAALKLLMVFAVLALVLKD